MASPVLRNQICSNLKLGVHLIRGRCSNISIGRLFTTSKGSLNLKPDPKTPDTTTTLPRSQRVFRSIRTLNPSKLVESDYIDFSLKSSPTLRTILQPSQSSEPSFPRSHRNAEFTANPWSADRFPAGTHGFMYYHVPTYGSPLAGELRFRITASRDPASFATGSDLLTERSMPWSYPLYKLVCRSMYLDFLALLLQDGLISQRTLDLVTAAVAPVFSAQTNVRHKGIPTLQGARHPHRRSATRVLSRFGQEFELHYATDPNFCAVVASPETILTHNMRHVTTFRVPVPGTYVQYSPFKGSLICCFERSTLPEHAGKRVVVIRVKRFIESDPIRPVPFPSSSLRDLRAGVTDALRPREGELIRSVRVGGHIRPWAADVDKVWRGNGHSLGIAPWKVLRVLFENEEFYGAPQDP